VDGFKSVRLLTLCGAMEPLFKDNVLLSQSDFQTKWLCQIRFARHNLRGTIGGETTMSVFPGMRFKTIKICRDEIVCLPSALILGADLYIIIYQSFVPAHESG